MSVSGNIEKLEVLKNWVEWMNARKAKIQRKPLFDDVKREEKLRKIRLGS